MQLSDLLKGLDPQTYAQLMQESAGNPNAVSPKGAAGLMQIMPATARDPGFGVMPLQNWDGKDPRTAPLEEQIRFGKDYQAAMEARYGNRAGGLAAYNAGPGRMDAVLAGKATMPAETKDYVQKITGGQAVPNMPAQAPVSPPMPQPAMNALQAMPPQMPQMNTQSRDGYEDRTAGLKKFNNPQSAPKVSTMSALEKFGNLVKEARQPGSFEAQAQPQAMQPPQMPQEPSGLAQFASAFIPGLGGALEGAQKRKMQEYQSQLARYVSQLPAGQDIQFMAGQDPAYMDNLIAYKQAQEAASKAAPATTGLPEGFMWQNGQAVQIPGLPAGAAIPKTTGLPVGQMWENGKAVPIPGVQQPKGDFKEFQLSAASFAQRMANADRLLTPLENEENSKNGFASALEALPFGMGNAPARFARSETEQKYKNLADEWIRAKLRKESGAAIGKDEMEQEYNTYFPRVGDSPEVIAQKKLLRENATKVLIESSNGAYEQLFGKDMPVEPPKAPTISNKEEFAKLPSGAEFIHAKTGKLMRKK